MHVSQAGLRGRTTGRHAHRPPELVWACLDIDIRGVHDEGGEAVPLAQYKSHRILHQDVTYLRSGWVASHAVLHLLPATGATFGVGGGGGSGRRNGRGGVGGGGGCGGGGGSDGRALDNVDMRERCKG